MLFFVLLIGIILIVFLVYILIKRVMEYKLLSKEYKLLVQKYKVLLKISEEIEEDEDE